ncbi:MAG: hypothetical protein WAT93_04260 [Pontixanthobacter sp.]
MILQRWCGIKSALPRLDQKLLERSGQALPPDDATAWISEAVEAIDDPLWQFELAATAAATDLGQSKPATWLANAILQIAAGKIALLAFGLLLLRHSGTSPSSARKLMFGAHAVAALHCEDTTRTRHLRTALVRHREMHPDQILPVILLGRPAARVSQAWRYVDPRAELRSHPTVRPLSFGSFLRAISAMEAHIFSGVRQTARYSGAISFRDRIAMSYRMMQGAVHAKWWQAASGGLNIRYALFGHTGNADTSQLERAMQANGTRTMHVVHGTNIGWPFAGLSDVAVFPSGADARLGASLPAYRRCIHLPLQRPEVSVGDGNWALLTSYTHLQHPSFADEGSTLDIRLVDYVRKAAERLGQDPAKIYWRPHPQIELVDQAEKARLVAAVAQAGFTRWPDDLPYARLGAFSAVITSPSTAVTDALRLGQPAIIASMSPLQRDLLYCAYPLLIEGDQFAARLEPLVAAITQVIEMQSRRKAFRQAWASIEPGSEATVGRLLESLEF